MPVFDDLLRGLQLQLDTLWYNLLFSLAGIHWSVLRAFLMMGYTVELLNGWLITNAFAPLIAQTTASLQTVVSLAFVVALIVLGLTYMLAAFARIRVVEAKSAIAWYLAAAIFFTLGPSLYQGMNDFRREVSGAFYAGTLSSLQAQTGSAFSSLGSVASTDLPMSPLCDNFGTFLPGAWLPTLDGIDVALAYLRADGIDIMGYFPPQRDIHCQIHPADPITGTWAAGSVPWDWRTPGSFFANDRDPLFFPAMTPEARAASLNLASAAHGRLLTGWPLVLFGVVEQLVALLLSLAQGLTFLSFGVAVMFAFFKKTEVIARSIIDLWIELIVQTIVIALIQSLVVSFFLIGTAAGNVIVVLGMGLICLVFMVIVLFSGVKAVWNSFNRLFGAFGQATGGAVISPASAAVLGAGLTTAGVAAAAGAVGAGVSIGSNALAGMTALHQGATPAQAAGLTFGGVQPLSGAARTLAYLPGVRGTALGETAEQFSEGAATRRVAADVPGVGRVTGPLVGTLLLTNRDPEKAEYDEQGRVVARPMLIPAVGASLGQWSTPNGKPGRWGGDEAEYTLDENGEVIPNPSARRRMGQFTSLPFDAGAQARSEHASAMHGEELEQHLSERLGVLTGELRVTGAADVASVLGDVIRLFQTERGGQPGSIDHLTTAALMARAMGVTPVGDTPAIQRDLARFGMFTQEAAQLGLSPELTERAARAVRQSPERTLPEDLRSALIEGVRATRQVSPEEAGRLIGRLEVTARLLPERITARGQMRTGDAE
jgi:hypothetical protein